MGANAGAYPPQHQEFYPSSNTFPPPPANDYAAREGGYPAYSPAGEYPPGEYPPYNPADYPPPPGATPQPGINDHPYDPAHHNDAGYPPANETYAGDTRYEGHYGRSGPENVSPPSGNRNQDHNSNETSDDPQDGSCHSGEYCVTTRPCAD